MRPGADELWRILGRGIQAPSAENKHYLRFQVLDASVRLLTTDRPTWVERPHRRLLALLAYGAVVENMALRSIELGHAMVTTWFPDATLPDLVAELSWSSAAGRPDPLRLAIGSRDTNRRIYRRAKLPADTLARLSAACDAVPGSRLVWLDDPNRRVLALRAMRIAETERFRRRELHQERFGAVRFGAGWHATAEEWLSLATLQVEPPMRLPFALLRRWSWMRAATWFGAHHVLGFRAGYLPCALTPHIGLVLGRASYDDLAQLVAGCAFERVWLAAAAENLALQPMAAATVLARQRPGNDWVSTGVKARLERLLEELCPGADVEPYMLFRLGVADAPSVGSGRSPPSHYIAWSLAPTPPWSRRNSPRIRGGICVRWRTDRKPREQ